METDKKINPYFTVLELKGFITKYGYYMLKTIIENLHQKKGYKLNINTPGGDACWASEIIILMSNPEVSRCVHSHAINQVNGAGIYIYSMGAERTSNWDTTFHINRHYDATTGQIPAEISPEELMFWRILALRTEGALPMELIIDMATSNKNKGVTLSAQDAKRFGIVHSIGR
jgi:ATP-dependent protease ClpP protease subunit